MPHFPQLATGATGQYPMTRRVLKRTVVNPQADGRMWKLADAAWSQVEWRLELKGLTEAEWGALESLFHAVEGRLKSFTFLDPTDNLLAWSEQLGTPAWTIEPLLQLTTNIADPLGSSRATRVFNSGAAPQKIEQTLSIPGWRQYCVSLYARREQAGEVWVFARTGTAMAAQPFAIGPAWKRLEYPVKLSTADELIHFGVELEAGASAEVFGIQVEAQPGASKYKKTLGRNGVYAEARFLDDALVVRAEGPEQYACVVHVGARL
ncbi:MAG: hypothetical protein AAB225_17425 [Acidobacteriota bacterium]